MSLEFIGILVGTLLTAGVAQAIREERHEQRTRREKLQQRINLMEISGFRYGVIESKGIFGFGWDEGDYTNLNHRTNRTVLGFSDCGKIAVWFSEPYTVNNFSTYYDSYDKCYRDNDNYCTEYKNYWQKFKNDDDGLVDAWSYMCKRKLLEAGIHFHPELFEKSKALGIFA